MNRLVLMRHAKTEGHHAEGDRARELTAKGRADAADVGNQLAELGLQYAMVSTAVRTRQTFECLGLAIPAEFHEVFYTDGAETMLQRISETESDVTGLLIIGHEPVVPHLAARLGDASDRAASDALLCSFPPGSFVEFTFDGDWADLEPDNLQHVSLTRVERPHRA